MTQNDNAITIPADSIDISGESRDVDEKISLTDLSAGQCEADQ
ncbi:MAG: hypothetical protein ACLUTA_08850 [Blautia wexlerae]